METTSLASLADVFQCTVCLQKVQDPRLCPNCSQLYCFSCIQRCLKRRHQCPHCRGPLHPNNLVNVHWVDDVTKQLDRLDENITKAVLYACARTCACACVCVKECANVCACNCGKGTTDVIESFIQYFGVSAIVTAKGDIQMGEDLCREMTGLHVASYKGKVDLASLLIENGADVKAKNDNHETPLHWAASGGHSDMVHLLLENGADCNALDKDDVTPLHWAAAGGHTGVAQILVQIGRCWLHVPWLKHHITPLHLAAARGHSDIARILLSFSASVDGSDFCEADKYQMTPLHFAAAWGHSDTAYILLANGANVNATCVDQLTPLHQAGLNGHLDVFSLLVRNGASLDARDHRQKTPLFYAAKRQDEEFKTRGTKKSNKKH